MEENLQYDSFKNSDWFKEQPIEELKPGMA